MVIYGGGPPPTKSCDPLTRVLGDHVTNEKGYISTFKIPMAIKLDRDVAFHEKMLSTKHENC